MYRFTCVPGNSNRSVGWVEYADVLWESFGTDVAPEKGDLIKSVSYKDGYIVFQTADTFREGNAVIAARDIYGNILWSWHIWFTDQLSVQVYYSNHNDMGFIRESALMMDRNLGAISATPGDAGALGLLYQWGRKDPFLGSSSISSSTEAKSTITWPSAVMSDSNTGTPYYAISHPTTFITSEDSRYWLYRATGWRFLATLWTDSRNAKSIYDPCPPGWRVPDGGENGVWKKAGFGDTTYDTTNKGISFSIESPSSTWYPACGFRDPENGSLKGVGEEGACWAAAGQGPQCFDSNGKVYIDSDNTYACGLSVRCVLDYDRSTETIRY